jgi:hypothetical protein
MLRTVCKKVGKTVELEIFPAPEGAKEKLIFNPCVT